MNSLPIDFAAILDAQSDPIGVCDESGRIMWLNHAARGLLGAQANGLRLNLTDRETMRQMRITGDPEAQEFFLADVLVEGGRGRPVSVSLREVSRNLYRVAFTPAGRSGGSVHVQILESVVNLSRHLELFDSVDKVIALFGASFGEVFPDYSFAIQFPEWGGGRAFHQCVYSDNSEREAWSDDALEATPQKLKDDQLRWRLSTAGWSTGVQVGHHLDAPVGWIRVERADAERFGVEEREAFQTFAQQMGFALSRWAEPARIDAVGPIIDQLDAGIVVCDSRRTITLSNATFARLSRTEDPTGEDVIAFFDADTAGRLRTAAASVMAGGEGETFDGVLSPAEGGRVPLMLQVSALRSTADSGGQPGFVVTCESGEVTLHELEERLNRAEHLMNIGQLATGVAHELKNPLTSILNYADYLLHKYQDAFFDDRDAERLRRIIEGVEHIDAFVGDLMTLARPGEATIVDVSVHGAIRDASRMCALPVEQAGAELLMDLQAEFDVITGSRTQLQQVVANLVTNAVAAMSTPGTVTVSTNTDAEWIVVRVSDTAGGIEPEVLARIFEPFFTTRSTDGGNGLGLAIVRSIVERHRGEIDVDSTLGEGTTFILRFPLKC